MDLAERLGKTVEELRLGHPVPLSNREFLMWQARDARAQQIAEVNGRG